MLLLRSFKLCNVFVHANFFILHYFSSIAIIQVCFLFFWAPIDVEFASLCPSSTWCWICKLDVQAPLDVMFTMVPTCVLYIVFIHVVLIPCFADSKHCFHFFLLFTSSSLCFCVAMFVLQFEGQSLESAMGSQKDFKKKGGDHSTKSCRKGKMHCIAIWSWS